MRSIAEKRLWSTCLRRWTAGPTRIWASIGRLAQFGAVKRTAGMPSRPPVGRRGWGPDRGGGSAPGACAGRFHRKKEMDGGVGYVDVDALKATELRLGLPGSDDPSEKPRRDDDDDGSEAFQTLARRG
ncbi:hypothetical protein BHE74_00033577 [Ensete ventricosum]|nr:hypothetical protein BHE74_00033577 [Ensete ventricosum]